MLDVFMLLCKKATFKAQLKNILQSYSLHPIVSMEQV